MAGRLLRYALVGGGLVLAVAGAVAVLVGPGRAEAVWYAAATAYVVQLVAFGGLLKVGGRNRAFFVVWGGGTLLRFGVLAAAGAWAMWSASPAPAALLLSLAGFLFLLLLLEPVFFRKGLESE